jgi:hypothetical protein
LKKPSKYLVILSYFTGFMVAEKLAAALAFAPKLCYFCKHGYYGRTRVTALELKINFLSASVHAVRG